jgi:F-type H+-transporting ATPase subunit epsilon
VEKTMNTFAFELVSPEKILFSGEVLSVVVPGVEGQFQVFKGHAPMMSAIEAGVVTIADSTGTSMRIFVRGGFADVAPTGLTLLAESATALEEVNVESLAQDIQGAEDQLKSATSEIDRARLADKLQGLQDLRQAVLN